MKKCQTKKLKTVRHRPLSAVGPSRSKHATLKKGAEIFVKKFSPIIKKLANE